MAGNRPYPKKSVGPGAGGFSRGLLKATVAFRSVKGLLCLDSGGIITAKWLLYCPYGYPHWPPVFGRNRRGMTMIPHCVHGIITASSIIPVDFMPLLRRRANTPRPAPRLWYHGLKTFDFEIYKKCCRGTAPPVSSGWGSNCFLCPCSDGIINVTRIFRIGFLITEGKDCLHYAKYRPALHGLHER